MKRDQSRFSTAPYLLALRYRDVCHRSAGHLLLRQLHDLSGVDDAGTANMLGCLQKEVCLGPPVRESPLSKYKRNEITNRE